MVATTLLPGFEAHMAKFCQAPDDILWQIAEFLPMAVYFSHVNRRIWTLLQYIHVHYCISTENINILASRVRRLCRIGMSSGELPNLYKFLHKCSSLRHLTLATSMRVSLEQVLAHTNLTCLRLRMTHWSHVPLPLLCHYCPSLHHLELHITVAESTLRRATPVCTLGRRDFAACIQSLHCLVSLKLYFGGAVCPISIEHLLKSRIQCNTLHFSTTLAEVKGLSVFLSEVRDSCTTCFVLGLPHVRCKHSSHIREEFLDNLQHSQLTYLEMHTPRLRICLHRILNTCTTARFLNRLRMTCRIKAAQQVVLSRASGQRRINVISLGLNSDTLPFLFQGAILHDNPGTGRAIDLSLNLRLGRQRRQSESAVLDWCIPVQHLQVSNMSCAVTQQLLSGGKRCLQSVTLQLPARQLLHFDFGALRDLCPHLQQIRIHGDGSMIDLMSLIMILSGHEGICRVLHSLSIINNEDDKEGWSAVGIVAFNQILQNSPRLERIKVIIGCEPLIVGAILRDCLYPDGFLSGVRRCRLSMLVRNDVVDAITVCLRRSCDSVDCHVHATPMAFEQSRVIWTIQSVPFW